MRQLIKKKDNDAIIKKISYEHFLKHFLKNKISSKIHLILHRLYR